MFYLPSYHFIDNLLLLGTATTQIDTGRDVYKRQTQVYAKVVDEKKEKATETIKLDLPQTE